MSPPLYLGLRHSKRTNCPLPIMEGSCCHPTLCVTWWFGWCHFYLCGRNPEIVALTPSLLDALNTVINGVVLFVCLSLGEIISSLGTGRVPKEISPKVPIQDSADSGAVASGDTYMETLIVEGDSGSERAINF